MKNDTAVDDQARRLATSLSRGLPLGQLDDRFCSSYNGIMVGNVWTLAKGSAESEAAALLNTEGVSTDLSVNAGICTLANWSLYMADGVSTDLDCTPQVRRPRTCAGKAAETLQGKGLYWKVPSQMGGGEDEC